jgi:hypothetical protein
MDATTATIVIVSLLVLASIAFFAVFRGKGQLEIDARKGKLKAKGENPPPPSSIPSGVKVKGTAGRDILAESTAEGGVDVDATAKRDIKATHSPVEAPPKP